MPSLQTLVSLKHEETCLALIIGFAVSKSVLCARSFRCLCRLWRRGSYRAQDAHHVHHAPQFRRIPIDSELVSRFLPEGPAPFHSDIFLIYNHLGRTVSQVMNPFSTWVFCP